MTLDEAVGLIKKRWPDVVSSAEDEPVFVFAAGWRSGSTMLQRMLLHNCLVWGEPYGSSGLIERLSQPLCRFAQNWPLDNFFIGSAHWGARLGEEWTASLYPSIRDLLEAHVGFFRLLFAEPSRQRGYARWGLKEVRYGVEHAVYLRWLFPRAKFLFLIRNPYECWSSYRRGGANVMRFWPEEVITTPEQFGTHWLKLAEGFCNRVSEVNGFLLRYELLTASDFDVKPLEQYVNCGIDLLSRKIVVGASPPGQIPDDEMNRLRQVVDPLANSLGYTTATSGLCKPVQVNERSCVTHRELLRTRSDCLVSVVIPCFNSAQYLVRATQSILAQNVSHTEIIIVDDGSTDGSRTIAESLVNQFACVRLVEQSKNAGPAAARNLGLRNASGRYLCFLDADDEYVPGFFSTVLPLFEKDAELGAVVTGIELVNCHRDVHPLQLQAIARSIPSNIMVRKATAEILGGFPESPVFRGVSAGEDVRFKVALSTWFRVTKCEGTFLRYLVKPGSHVDYFLNRSKIVDGKVVFTSFAPEENSGDKAIAEKWYDDQIRARVSALYSLNYNDDTSIPLANRLFQAVGSFETLRQKLESITGFLSLQEGFALYHWAKIGPGNGAIVEIGSLLGRSTCWLASGTCSTGREKVVAVDHFGGSPEHQGKGSHPVSAIVETGSALSNFLRNVERCSLLDWVEVQQGNSVEVGCRWHGPIRLLFIDGDHSYESVRKDVEAWAKHVIRGGIMAFHDVDVWPGVTRHYREFLDSHSSWKEICRVGSLRFTQRKA